MDKVQTQIHDYGLRINLKGELTTAEAKALSRDIRTMLGDFNEPFGLLVDRRAVTGVFQAGVRLLMGIGSSARQLRRVVIVYDSRIAEPQFSRNKLIKDVSDQLVYLDVAQEPDWKAKAGRLLASHPELPVG